MGDMNRKSEKGSDNRKGHQAETVKNIEGEKVGGKSGVRFPVHNHPDKSVVSKALKE
jgi:hypothetical protein